MYTLEEIKKFTVVLNAYNVITNENVREKFLELYSYTFDEYPACTGCPNDIEQAIQKFMWIINKHNDQTHLTKATMLSKYTMKSKVRLYSTSLNMVVTQYNCTDAIAEALIKENPKHIDLFILNSQSEPKAIETFSVVNPTDEKPGRSDVETTFVRPDAEVVIEDNIAKNYNGKKRGRKKKVA